jgi:hypothetical protein
MTPITQIALPAYSLVVERNPPRCLIQQRTPRGRCFSPAQPQPFHTRGIEGATPAAVAPFFLISIFMRKVLALIAPAATLNTRGF